MADKSHYCSYFPEIRGKDLFMHLKDIVKLVEGTPLNPDVGMDVKIRGVCGADLMSDVLASSRPKAILFHCPNNVFQANNADELFILQNGHT